MFQDASEAGRRGGSSTSDAKRAAARANGAKGWRPVTKQQAIVETSSGEYVVTVCPIPKKCRECNQFLEQ
jgi:hypothetical protein